MYMLYSSHNNDNCCLKIATLWEYAMHSIQACETSQCTIKACKSLPKHVSCQMKLSISVFKIIDGNLVLLLCFSQTREL